MEISYLNGCNYSLEVDGEEFAFLPKEHQREVCSRVLKSGKCSSSSLKKFYIYYVSCDKGEEIDEDTIDNSKIEELCHDIPYQEDCSEATMQSFIENFVEEQGKFKDLGYCDTCGSYNEMYTIKI